MAQYSVADYKPAALYARRLHLRALLHHLAPGQGRRRLSDQGIFSCLPERIPQSLFFLFFIAAVSAVCCTDFFYFGKSELLALRFLAFLIAGFLLFFLFAAVDLLPLTAQFNNTIGGTFRAALGIASQNLHWSFCLLILNVALPLVILFRFLPLIVFGPALPVFLQSYLLNRIFKNCSVNEI